MASTNVDGAMIAEVRSPFRAEGRVHCSLWSSKIAARLALEGGPNKGADPSGADELLERGVTVDVAQLAQGERLKLTDTLSAQAELSADLG